MIEIWREKICLRLVNRNCRSLHCDSCEPFPQGAASEEFCKQAVLISLKTIAGQ